MNPGLPDHLAPPQARTVALARAFLGDQGGGHLDPAHRCIVDYSWPAAAVEATVADPDPWRWLMRLVEVEQRGLARVCLYAYVPGCPWQDEASEDWGTLDITSAGVVVLLQRYGLLPDAA